ncbi:MAG: gliding motility lipoprotein GldD [Bacteroidia bacterium]|nr:MAG: gliding motility lipoprotein GldD [Bacteroidia bacterium]
MEKRRKTNLPVFLVIIVICGLLSCRQVSVPKPKGYFRIDLPQKEYVIFNENSQAKDLPLIFEYPVYGNISDKVEGRSEQGWFNIEFPSYKARIYLTYKDIDGDLESLIEQTYTMNVKNHITKADAINEQLINDGENRIFGILYDLKGNTASAVQFYVTDSINHYLRGSLYFESEPNSDSLAPVIDFFREDIIHLIETLKWKEK